MILEQKKFHFKDGSWIKLGESPTCILGKNSMLLVSFYGCPLKLEGGEMHWKHYNPYQRNTFLKSYKTLPKTSSFSFLGGWRKNSHICRIIKDFSAFVVYSIDKIVKYFFCKRLPSL